MCAKSSKLKTSVKPKKSVLGRKVKPEKDISEVDMPLNPEFRGRQRFHSSLSIGAS
jgi:hypothetical protein